MLRLGREEKTGFGKLSLNGGGSMKYVAASFLLLAAPAAAEVKDSSSTHFQVEQSALIPLPPAAAYALLLRPSRWWNSAHTYSGDARNLSLDPAGGGCFCERLTDGGSVEHMRVVYAQPGTLLRLSGGLGPLQASAVAGTLTWTLKAEGQGTRLTQTYLVAGHIPGGADKLAAPVDRVLAEQLGRLAAAATVGDQGAQTRD